MREKTNSMRLLDSRGVTYKIHEFSPDIHSAQGVAEVVGIPAEQVYKTLVVIRERGKPLLVMVQGDATLDLKALAKAAGEKRLRMATHKEAEALTGLQVGGISALSLMQKGFSVYADGSVLSHQEVLVSAGKRGINLSLQPVDLLRVTGARTITVAKSPEGSETST
jgi:Cys-tRNA(Pro)/Cys-tRNA(Cys) deacylase